MPRNKFDLTGTTGHRRCMPLFLLLGVFATGVGNGASDSASDSRHRSGEDQTTDRPAGGLPIELHVTTFIDWIFGTEDKCAENPQDPECLPEESGPCAPWPKCAGIITDND